MREHRLYQADWLMRHYGFDVQELTEQADFDLHCDPKLAWALRHREQFPVDINRAPRELLLRVPGIGYKNASRILSIRRYHRLEKADLRRLGVAMKRATPFIVTADAGSAATLDRISLSRSMQEPMQLTLFEAGHEALSGQL